MNRSTLEVLYQCDDNYAALTGVSMISLMENNKEIHEINIHLLDDGISKVNIRRIRKAVAMYCRNIEIIDTKVIKQTLMDLKVEPYKGTYTTYYKLIVLGSLSIKSDRILYLDGDTIINSSLKKMFDIDLSNKIMGAAYDCVLNEYKKMINIQANESYYNCGVMLVNQKEWNSQNCEQKILQHLIQVRNQYFIVDQDVINVLFRDKIKTIDISYNLNSGFYVYGVGPSFKIYNLKPEYFFAKKYVEDVIKRGPTINHCMGGFTGRPWENNNIHPQNELYNNYFAISPWKNIDKINKSISNTFKIQRFLYHKAPMFVYWRIHRYFLYRFYSVNNKRLLPSPQDELRY